MYRLCLVLMAACTVVSTSSARAETDFPGRDSISREYYFYSGISFGTEEKYNPGDFMANGVYGVWQFKNNRDILGFPYAQAIRNTWNTLRRPVYSIQQFGTRKWLTTELFPGSLKLTHGQYFPNYFLHCLGAGMQSRKMEEWYARHNFRFPRAWSLVTMACEHFLEEVIEDSGDRGYNVDPVSDMYIFNPAGILLFFSDGVCRFFSETFSLNEWSLQPAVNLTNGFLENMGQFYVVKYSIPYTTSWKLIAYFGMQELFGIAKTFDGGRCIALTGGAIVNNLVATDISKSQKAYTANLRWSAGIFYDVDNSLLVSAVFTGAEHNKFRMNIYPGFLRIGQFSPGIFVDNTGKWAAGMSIRYCPFLGIAF